METVNIAILLDHALRMGYSRAEALYYFTIDKIVPSKGKHAYVFPDTDPLNFCTFHIILDYVITKTDSDYLVVYNA